jgi:ABC-type Fe3+-siderophore transport system permease subunit
VALLIGVGVASYLLRPTMTGNPLGKLQVAIVNEPTSFVVSAAVLIWFGYNEILPPMWVGLGAFLGLRIALQLLKGGKNHSFPSKNDRILYFVLQKHAMQNGLSTPAIDEIQNNLISYLNSTQRRKSDSKKST